MSQPYTLLHENYGLSPWHSSHQEAQHLSSYNQLSKRQSIKQLPPIDQERTLKTVTQPQQKLQALHNNWKDTINTRIDKKEKRRSIRYNKNYENERYSKGKIQANIKQIRTVRTSNQFTQDKKPPQEKPILQQLNLRNFLLETTGKKVWNQFNPKKKQSSYIVKQKFAQIRRETHSSYNKFSQNIFKICRYV